MIARVEAALAEFETVMSPPTRKAFGVAADRCNSPMLRRTFPGRGLVTSTVPWLIKVPPEYVLAPVKLRTPSDVIVTLTGKSSEFPKTPSGPALSTMLDAMVAELATAWTIISPRAAELGANAFWPA